MLILPINLGILYSGQSRLLQRNIPLAPPFLQTVTMLMCSGPVFTLRTHSLHYSPYYPNLGCVGTPKLRFLVDLLASRGAKMLLATEL